MSWVFDNSKSENSARLVALALADHADDFGRCWPGYERIAQKTRLCTRSIGRAIVELVKLGEVEIVREHYKGKQTKIYQMKQPDNLSTGQSVRKIPVTQDNLSTLPDNLSPITVNNHQKKEPSIKMPPQTMTESEKLSKQAFWDAWQENYKRTNNGREYIPIAADWKQIKERKIWGMPPAELVRLVNLWFIGCEESPTYFSPYWRSFAIGHERTKSIKPKVAQNDAFTYKPWKDAQK